jgi:putative tryptophan/tyrosine transport system substrate-binding protein
MQVDQLRRREFITLLGGATLTWPLAARAQQREQVRKIGVLISGAETDPDMQARGRAFRQELEKLGWLEGRNVRFDTRYAASDPARYLSLVKEMIASQPDVIVVQGTPMSVALRRETHTIPVVFNTVSDPIGYGLVVSLARPGGNLTGFLLYEEGIVGKWLAMLKEIAPHVTRAGLIAHPKVGPYEYFLRSATLAAPRLGIELIPSPVENAADIERVIDVVARVPKGGLIVLPDSGTILHRDVIIDLAARHRLPAVYGFRVFVKSGGLISYDTDPINLFARSASYVDRVLRGDKPADLPVQVPVTYETVLNLKTAMALGLDVPSAVLVRADEVIE